MKNYLSAFVFSIFLSSLFAQEWTALGQGASNEVVTMATDTINNILYVGGQFNSAGGVTNNYIAMWDGSSWQTVDGEFNGWVQRLKFIDGDLYAVGDFTKINGDTVNHVAKWDGTSWTGFGDGVDGTVYAVEIYQDTLYIGGSFVNSGANSVRKLAKWNGTSWETAGGGANFRTRDLMAYNGKLYAAGFFTEIGGNMFNRIAIWSNNAWEPMDDGMDYETYNLTVYKNEIYACGWFTPSPTKYIAKWNGTTWDDLNGGTNGRVKDMLVIDDTMYVTGNFTKAGIDTIIRVATWDGSKWGAVGGGVGVTTAGLDEGNTLAYFKNGLYVGGIFSTASGTPAANIARWGDIGPIEDTTTTTFAGHSSFDHPISIYPNPANDQITIESLPDKGNISIYNILGHQVSTFAIKGKTQKIATGDFAEGVYFIHIKTDINSFTTRLVIDRP